MQGMGLHYADVTPLDNKFFVGYFLTVAVLHSSKWPERCLTAEVTRSNRGGEQLQLKAGFSSLP